MTSYLESGGLLSKVSGGVGMDMSSLQATGLIADSMFR
jgi:hypothetical protein